VSATKLRSAFTSFDKSKNAGLLLIEEAKILADRKHASLDRKDRRANALTTMKLQLSDTLRAFNTLKGVPEVFRRFLSQWPGYLAYLMVRIMYIMLNC
jgi:hypothetical protein